ncbi:MAG: S-layer protein [Herbinix sp.]|jgi:hypothetical protein|nr:S-layer protein [Herbinix sp.]
MKKVICLIILATLLFTSTETAFAKKKDAESHNNHTHTSYQKAKDKHQRFKIKESPVIKYGKFKLPINPVKKGMDATLSFDKSTAILTIVKDNTTIVINFKNETVTVNGVADTCSDIFTAKNSKKMTVLIKYIAYLLGERVDVDDDEIIVEVPGVNRPTNVTLTPVGTAVVYNTLNNTTLFLAASAKITAGQAVGGRAELYVGSKLVATDASIAATDTEVTFTTSDNTPTNAELQNIVPVGGLVTVRLYNSSNKYTSSVNNPTLLVDYVSPTITGLASAIYNPTGNQLTINVNGAGAIGDLIDVTKISFYDYATGRTYQLTNTSNVGSSGVVVNANSLLINIGSADKTGISGFGNASLQLLVSPGSFINDKAGNLSAGFTTTQTIPVTATFTGLDLPTNVTITPYGTYVRSSTLNNTTLYMTASANITIGQATGGRAELYVGSKLVATDAYIGASDNTVTFTTADATPTTVELQTAVPYSGVVTVRLYNAYNYNVTSQVANPTLTVDYVAPALTGITSGIYDSVNKKLYLIATGAGQVGDLIDVTKISFYDSTLGRTYQLTNSSSNGSSGAVSNENTLLINVGDVDMQVLKYFGGSTVSLTISADSLLIDAAGNPSPVFASSVTVPVVVVK